MDASQPRQAQPSSTVRLGILLISIGLLAAVDHCFGLALVPRLWPLLITSMSIGFLGIYFHRNRREPLFLGVGTYLFCFSCLALYCNFTTWRGLAYLWPLFIAFLGFSFLAIYLFYSPKRYAVLLGMVMVAVAGIFLLLASLGSQYWWSILIMLGLSILVAERYHDAQDRGLY